MSRVEGLFLVEGTLFLIFLAVVVLIASTYRDKEDQE